MKELLARNWKSAVSEVFASIVGTLGIVFAISIILTFQASAATVSSPFWEYFKDGQLGLSILSLSGVIFIALRRHGRLSELISVLLYVFLIIPIMMTAVVIGINPGFKENVLGSGNVLLLWFIFLGLHLLWFFVLVLEPVVPTAQEAGQEEEDRVSRIKSGAINRG